MARVNVGVCPSNLSDQHLIAESVELTMITGALRKDGYKVKGIIPENFCLGKGHINFFKNKIYYLKERLDAVNNEMFNRGFSPGTKIDLEEFPDVLLGKWSPTLRDTVIVRQRIVERLKNPKSGKKDLHKYRRVPINDIDKFSDNLQNDVLYKL